MLNVIRHGNMLTAAGFITWAAVSGMVFYIAWLREGPDQALYVVTPLALVNLLGMWGAMDDVPFRPTRLKIAYGFQWLSALVLAWLVPVNFLPIYTVIWIGMIASVWPGKPTAVLLVITMVAWYVVMRFGWGEQNASLTVLLYGTFHFFALFSTRNARLAEEARDQMQALNRELLATQHLLSEASRQSERTRIARNLHDLLGHHLTALSINLQIAEHLSEGDAKEKVGEARALARLLLSDVREAVSVLREEGAVDLEQAVKLLIENVPLLDIELDFAGDLAIDDVELAETLLRCIQEALTNTMRHAGATRSWIRLWRDDSEIHLEFRDNGKLAGALQTGNGLTGIQERIGHLQGHSEFTEVDGGLTLRADIPLVAT